jgi:PBSX family phage terminase large subunit
VILTPAQSQIVLDKHRYRVINAGRRFGKSTLVSWEMFGIAVSQPEARVPYYAPTRDDARDIMWGMLKKVADPLIVDVNESRLEVIVRNKYGGRSQMLLYGWESVQERGKGVGVKNNHIYFDEVSKYKGFARGWEEILQPTLIDLKGGATFISTPNGFNHFHTLYNYENDPKVNEHNEWKSFHYTSYDNPFLDVEEINQKRASTTEDRFAQEYLADFRKMEGLVYKEFDRAKHLFDELPQVQFIETIAGVDFGFTHPAAVLSIKKDYDGNYWVVDEWYHTSKTDAMIADYIAAKQFNKVFPDPENAGGIQELRNRRVNVREVIKSKGSKKNGINVVRELFLANRLHIHRSCVNTIEELEIYAYPPKKAGQEFDDEEPLKENDHAMDALRYALMMDSGNPSGRGPTIHYGQQHTYGRNPVSAHKFLQS